MSARSTPDRRVDRKALRDAVETLQRHGELLRESLTDIACHPRDLTAVLAAVEHVIADDFRSPLDRGGS